MLYNFGPVIEGLLLSVVVTDPAVGAVSISCSADYLVMRTLKTNHALEVVMLSSLSC